MHQLPDIEFPAKHLSCYESVLLNCLRYQGLTEETPLVGTQAFFVFAPDDFTVSSRFNAVDEEWQRIYGYQVETQAVPTPTALREALIERLQADQPACLPVDLYALPHTLHYQQLHQHHYINIWGYDDERYYMVCPYYRFKGWVKAELIHNGFFSSVVAARGAYLIGVPEFHIPRLTTEQVSQLVEESCRYMLNLDIPQTLIHQEPRYLGLTGIHTFTAHFQALLTGEADESTHRTRYINLSRHLMAVGYSRHWFHKLIQSCQPALITPAQANELDSLFTQVVQAWNAIGLRLGMGVHGQRAALRQRVVGQLQQVAEQETHLFNTLLGMLPTYEGGTI